MRNCSLEIPAAAELSTGLQAERCIQSSQRLKKKKKLQKGEILFHSSSDCGGGEARLPSSSQASAPTSFCQQSPRLDTSGCWMEASCWYSTSNEQKLSEYCLIIT